MSSSNLFLCIYKKKTHQNFGAEDFKKEKIYSYNLTIVLDFQYLYKP